VSILKYNFSLTAQNIVLSFDIDGEVSEGRGSEKRKIVSIYTVFKEN
jgi:hypothetical protein